MRWTHLDLPLVIDRWGLGINRVPGALDCHILTMAFLCFVSCLAFVSAAYGEYSHLLFTYSVTSLI